MFSLEHGGLMAEIDEVFVADEIRSAGLGSLLVTRAGARSGGARLTRLQLQLGAKNERARHFYERHGFGRARVTSCSTRRSKGGERMLQPGLMMDRPLLISGIVEHAAAQFGATLIASRETHGPIFRYTYAECAARARRLANALRSLGMDAGSAVGSLAWNNHRHLEAYYAVSGSGLVMHTCNPRLHPEQLIYIINHAGDRAMLFDSSFAALIEAIAPHCPKVEAWICLSDAANMPRDEVVAGLLCYET